MDERPIAWNPSAQDSEGVGTLTRAVPKVDGDHRAWELVVTTILGKSQDLEPMALFAGSSSYFHGAAEELAASDLKIKPLKGNAVHLDFLITDDEGNEVVAVENVSATIRFVKLKLNTNVKALQLRINLHGVPVESSNAIVSLLERRVLVRVRNDQPVMFGETSKPGQSDAPEVDQLVAGKSGDKAVVGTMIKLSKGKIVVDDFGTLYTLDDHTSALWVESDDNTDVKAHVAEYKTATENLDQRPSWACLVEAMGLGWSQGIARRPDGNTVYLNAEVIQRAVTMHTDVQAPEPASEAG